MTVSGSVLAGLSEAVIDEFTAIVGPAHVLVGEDLTAPFQTDWTRRWSGPCGAVLRPADRDQVSRILRACHARGLSVVPQGGNTGLVGGSVPRAGGSDIVLSLTRLDHLGEVDRTAGQVDAGAGVTLARLQAAAAIAGYGAGMDLGARDSATVGGLAACNAGGLRTVRDGTARQRITGIEAVLADGSVIRRMSGLVKDTAGYDLPGLLIGSEGTLGVITEVRWRLVPERPARATALVRLDSVTEAESVAAALRDALPSLELLELMTEAGIALTLEHLGASAPLPVTAAWLLVECAARTSPADELIDALEALDLAERTVMAPGATGRRQMLRIRESHTDAVSRAGTPHKFDVGIPIGRLASFVEAATATSRRIAPGSQFIVWGHLGDGNLHVNVLGAPPDEERLDAAMLALTAAHDGTISAEHGIGVHKPAYLSLVRSDADRAAMAAIKAALDPGGILNPGVIFGTAA
jgi:FAD/FMN-containing dehydrogenase